MASDLSALSSVSAPVDSRIAALLASGNPSTIDDVVAHMDALDRLLPLDDGLRWFNRLYRMVTLQVRDNPPGGDWQNPVWLTRLDVVFAGFYFDALRAWIAGQPVPSSWKAFFAARHRTGIARVQFAVAGMNAHINHDLALALLTTNAESRLAPTPDSPEGRDYQSVNALLDHVMPSALAMLAADPLGELAEDTGAIGRLLAFWNICAARDLAWNFADQLRLLAGPAYTAALATQDAMTGALGRAILILNAAGVDVSSA